ncbi:hypothetical protein HK098_002113 [Nowakowskiella sp. JEL0407]|nr:hypothetical protein HK098_002113 [Nowakowskiella sp. JEL0407]
MGETPLRMYLIKRICKEYFENNPNEKENEDKCQSETVMVQAAKFFPLMQMSEIIPVVLTGWIYGWLSDKIGRKPIILIAITGIVIDRFNIFLNAHFSLNLYLLCIGKFITGSTGGLLVSFSVCLAAIIDFTDLSERSVYVGIVQGMGLVSISLGSLISGTITKVTLENWSIPFGISISLGLVSIFWISFSIPESLSREHKANTHIAFNFKILKSLSGQIMMEMLKRVLGMLSEVPFVIMIPFFLSLFAFNMKGSARSWYTYRRYNWETFPDAVYGACESVTAGIITVTIAPFVERIARTLAHLHPQQSETPHCICTRIETSETRVFSESDPLLPTVVQKISAKNQARIENEIRIGFFQLRIYLVVVMVENALFGITSAPWMIYTLLPFSAFGQVLVIPARTMIAHIIEPSKLGFTQSVLLMIEQLIAAISAQLGGYVWGGTVATFIPALFLICAASFVT